MRNLGEFFQHNYSSFPDLITLDLVDVADVVEGEICLDADHVEFRAFDDQAKFL